MGLRIRGSALAGKTQQEITPEIAFNLSLIDAGGNLWTSDDSSKKRIYFNSVRVGEMFMNGFFDCVDRTWHVQLGDISGEEFGRVVSEKIAAGIKFN